MNIFILFILMFLLITNNQIVLAGASYGLMLWYKNVLPLLLPFMLISGHIENSVISATNKDSRNKKLALPSIIILGLFCGYPIGAKANAYFLQQDIIKKRTGNLLLPICNNISPMFFLGFIISHILNNSISPILGYAIIFTPYILILIIEYIIYPKTQSNIPVHKNILSSNKLLSRSISQESISQITHVGLYIMICCIITEFILSMEGLNPYIKLILIGITEITSGVTHIGNSPIIETQIKTALILACTSFGGISSIMQTAKVIQGSGLSLIHYIFVKLVCAISTFFLYLLIV
ncbi:MAG: hypothetical protein IKJ73_02685 [Lachnospiraceae bacterium]|nr:hypothetical protein [Lachnospiraceae bacterium]